MRLAVLVSSVVITLSLLVISKAMADGPKTVFSPKPSNEAYSPVSIAAEEQPSSANNEPIHIVPASIDLVGPVDIAVGSSFTINLSGPFKTIHVADPRILEILPLSDRSMLLVGKGAGITDIDVFGENAVQIAKFQAFIGLCTDCRVIELHNTPGSLAGSAIFECQQSGGCRSSAPSLAPPPSKVVNTNSSSKQ
jgi:hypothetical protein